MPTRPRGPHYALLQTPVLALLSASADARAGGGSDCLDNRRPVPTATLAALSPVRSGPLSALSTGTLAGASAWKERGGQGTVWEREGNSNGGDRPSRSAAAAAAAAFWLLSSTPAARRPAACRQVADVAS
eukprot:365308-Chlamydomonas_euryale.AAC.7